MPTSEEIALQRIQEAAESGAAALDLSDLKLKTLPPEIGKLASLQELNLCCNQLAALPPEVLELPNLKVLDIGSNPIDEIPPELWQKTDWETLGLGRLKLTTLPPEVTQLAHLQSLNLSWNQLTALPPEIGQLANLQKLDLSVNQLAALPPEFGQLTNLQVLYLSYNQLTALPPEIGQLANLQKLDLSVNQLAALPPEFGQLTNLQVLYLSYNQLTALPPEVGQFANLQSLYLAGNELAALLPEIWDLPDLKALSISGNPLDEIPPELWQKTNWEILGLGELNLTALPSEVGQLTNLQILDFSGNRLTALPPEIGQLANLQELNLSWNQLTALLPEFGQLAHLQELDLSVNNITALPPEIGQLANLQKLDLSSNQLTALPPEVTQLANLQKLDLSGNQLTALLPEVTQLANLQALDLRGNPLTLALPRALLGRENAQDILDFYRPIWEGGGRALGEARLLAVGQPGVGKTSLVHRLLDGSFDPDRKSTMTVETHTLLLGEHTARIWDFGGQEFMHATHPFFFSARAVYLLALNVRHTLEQNRLEYWLRTIRAFGGDAPIVVVGNHADADQHRLDLPENRLRREYPNIRAFVQTSAADGTGLEALRAALAEAVDSLPHVRVLFANTHLAVKEALEEEQKTHHIIPRQRYAELCAAQGVKDKRDQKTLLLLMHDLGVVLDFRDKHGEPLSSEGILNPNWVTEAVYRIITDERLRTRTKGRLDGGLLRKILPDYIRPHRRLMLDLMRRFELAYPEGADVWWLPNAMPQDEPAAAGGWAADALTFEYRYPELPESVITRFIVRAHEWIDAGQVWRWGVILAKDGNRALVRASVPDKRVDIRIDGPEHTRRDLLAFIRAHFDKIHETFAREGGGEKTEFRIEAFILPSEYPGLRLSFDKLLAFERDGIYQIPETWNDKTIMLNVPDLLNGYTTPEARADERKRRFPEEAERMAKEIHYHEHRETRIFGNVSDTIIDQGTDNTITQRVEHSFSTPANPDLAPLLAQLTAAVEAMLSHLDDDTARKTQKNLQRLQEELQEKSPDKAWYSVSIEGLKAAAQDVGEIGAPVLKLAGQILALLAATGL